MLVLRRSGAHDGRGGEALMAFGDRRKPLKRTEFKRKAPMQRSSRKPVIGPGSSPKPRKPLKVRSAKTAERDRYYSRLRSVWLDDRCEAMIDGVHSGPATDVHHRKGRGVRWMLDVSTWLAVCRSCHMHIESFRDDARAAGFLFRENDEVPAMASFAQCKSCGRSIYWVRSDADRSIPLIADDETRMPKAFDDVPGLPGRIQETHRELSLSEELLGIVVRVLGKDSEADPELETWRSHFSDCPHADQHRRG